MSDITPNDKAYLNIAIQLRRLENDIVILNIIKTMSSRQDAYMVDQLSNIRTADVYTDKVKALIPMIELLGRGREAINEIIERQTKRRIVLQELADVYLAGGDIVAAKLTGLAGSE
jgi:hypothetical protein